jgi:hypothetical protein
VRYVPPPWAGAPLYELPVVVHIGQFLHRSPTLVMAIKSADVFSTGCSFDLTWTIKRGEQSDEVWAGLNEAFFRPGPGPGYGRSPGADSMLLFGAQFPDGSKASTGSHSVHGLFEGNQQPDPPVLLLRGDGSSGAEDEFAGTGTVWLWPLPPEGKLLLVAQWKDMGLEECSVMLDGGRLREAVAGVQEYW